MKDRLLKFIHSEGISSAKLAEKIGVQPSSISHILSGRNKPSFDFITKVLNSFPNLNSDWLIVGKGDMYKTVKQPTLFDSNANDAKPISSEKPSSDLNNPPKSIDNIQIPPSDKDDVQSVIEKIGTKIEKVVIFYSDKTFKEYSPKSE